MFSTNPIAPVITSQRNPRRRQRTDSDESVTVQQLSKRFKRSGITAESFQPPSARSANGHLRGNNSTPAQNGIGNHTEKQRESAEYPTSLTSRSKEANRKKDWTSRGSKGDGSVELTRNGTYAVTALATTPFQLQQQRSSEQWCGELAPNIGFAIATYHSRALVWRYHHSNATNSSKPLTIRLLYASEDSNQPLPLGTIVPSSPEPGLLIVMPVSGKVTYWESLSSAASVDLGRQKQQAVQGVVAGMAFGEHVTKITEAEPQGFLLSISSGRVAHLTIADPQGRASIHSRILHSSGTQSGGLFGSLRNVFGGTSWPKDLAAVKVGSSVQKGQRQCAIGTAKGSLQLWDLNWNGAHTLKYEMDLKPKLLDSIRDTGAFPKDTDSQYLQVLDFAFLPAVVTGQEVTSTTSKSATRLLMLTAISSDTHSRYNLHVLDVVDDTVDVLVVHPISCYTTVITPESSKKVQLLVPEPGQTAYVAFAESVVLVSLEEIQETPDSQLQSEARRLPDPFQDVIDFRRDKGYQVVGCAAEVPPKGHHDSSCILMVQGYGLIKVTVAPLENGVSSTERATITAETKLQQAVFFGSQQSLLDLSGRSEIQFSTEDVQSAALRISRSITSSSSKYLPTAGPSMEQQLQRRINALADLIRYLRKYYQPLDAATRWELLFEAEKLAAAMAVWRIYEAIPKDVPRGEKILLDEIVECISEEEKSENQPDHHETDAVRHWLIHDVWRLEHLVPWTLAAVTLLHSESVQDGRPMSLAYRARLISEANDIHLAALETAYVFRQTNATLYGFDEDTMVEGLLRPGLKDMPQTWTSTGHICNATHKLAVCFQDYALDIEHANSDGVDNGPSPELFRKIADENMRLVELSCKTHIERSRLLQSSEDFEIRNRGLQFEHESSVSRRDLLKGLVDMGQYLAAIRLGEKYRDLEALAEVLESEIQCSQEDLHNSTSDDEREEIQAKIAICERQVHSYFDKYGNGWADAFFARFVAQGRISNLLVHGPKQRHHLTSFLRAHPELSSFGWINEVTSEGNYAAAADDLRRAQEQTDTLWARKAQLSMAKLANMAASAEQQTGADKTTVLNQAIDKTMDLLIAQDQLVEILGSTLRGALNDTSAKVDILMQQHGSRFVKSKPTLRLGMREHFAQLVEDRVLDAEDLIDTISLLDEDSLHPGKDFTGRRFLVSLQLVQLCSFETREVARKNLLEDIVWRRCIIQNDWAGINRTELKDDATVEAKTGMTTLFKTLREGFKTGFWDDNPPPHPSGLLGAGTTIESLLTLSRYDHVPESTLSGLARDLDVEDKALQECMDKGRLGEWWIGIVDAAKLSVRNEADRIGEERNKVNAAEQEFREEMERRDIAAWGVGGAVAGEMTIDMDQEGDVVMGM
ncbi:MAG: hypothetical protein L6R37_001396 [Teloschistes peruensis]|nr:MAG: hypothetical protein L6R37_001396 [Teloschistes peruensis]